MESGDISNTINPRVVFVFETTLGVLEPSNEGRHYYAQKFRRWKAAARCWTVDPLALKQILHISWTSAYSVDLATYLPEPEAEALEERLPSLGIPFGNFYITNVQEMSRVIANYPHVAAIFDCDPSRVLTYGHKGRNRVAL